MLSIATNEIKYNKEVVEILEDLLKRANNGEISNILVGIIMPNRTIETITDGNIEVSMACFILKSLDVAVNKLVELC